MALDGRHRRKGTVDCLIENADDDPEPGVQIRNLEMLLRLQDRSRATMRAFARAKSSAVPESRVLGAIGSGALDVLRRIALDGGAPPRARLQAIRHLAGAFPPDAAHALLVPLSRDPSEDDDVRNGAIREPQRLEPQNQDAVPR